MNLSREHAILTLQKRRNEIDRALSILKHKRSYRPSEKAMVAAGYVMEQEALDMAIVELQRQVSGL